MIKERTIFYYEIENKTSKGRTFLFGMFQNKQYYEFISV